MQTKFRILLIEEGVAEEKRMMRIMSAAVDRTVSNPWIDWVRQLNHGLIKLLANPAYDYDLIVIKHGDGSRKLAEVMHTLGMTTPVFEHAAELDAHMADTLMNMARARQAA